MPIVLEKARVNAWNLGGFFLGMCVTAFGWGATYTSLTGQIDVLKRDVAAETQARRDRGASTDAKFKAIEEKMPTIDRLGDQITRLAEITAAQAKGLEETNKRIDRVVESQSGKLDTILANVGNLTTEVRVIQSQIKNQGAVPNRTRMPILVPR